MSCEQAASDPARLRMPGDLPCSASEPIHPGAAVSAELLLSKSPRSSCRRLKMDRMIWPDWMTNDLLRHEAKMLIASKTTDTTK
jgi:hypothetical protein